MSRIIPIVILVVVLVVAVWVFSRPLDPCPKDPLLSPVTSPDLRQCLNKMWAESGHAPIVDHKDPRYEYWASLPSISAVATDMKNRPKNQ